MISRKMIINFVLFSFLFLSSYSIPKNTISTMSNKIDNETLIVFRKNNVFNKIAAYGFISNPEKYLYYFENESCIGYLPKKTEKILPSQNILNNTFICFFVDSKNGGVSDIAESRGYDFHIKDHEKNMKWVIILLKGKARVLLINDDGESINDIEFSTKFDGDYVMIKKLNTSVYQIMISMLGRDSFYEINLVKKESKFLYEEETNYH
ncbi:MAG: hypothetical protein QM387_04510 [Spirochaetota bacterium]|nr:hypothetical protein [Spirochaetota bacterium]HPY53884.1 hypothetical protein [Treponemataceae bacterium]